MKHPDLQHALYTCIPILGTRAIEYTILIFFFFKLQVTRHPNLLEEHRL